MSHPLRKTITPVVASLGLLVLFMSGPAAAAQEIVLLIDNSGSMIENDPQSLTKQAVAQFVQASPDGSRVALIKFDKAVEVLSPLLPMNETTRLDMLTRLDRINFKGPLTNSGEALARAIEELRHWGKSTVTKTIVFMSDGIIDTGNKTRDLKTAEKMRADLARTAVDAGIRIFSIAFTANADEKLMRDLAETTGGMYFQPLQPGDLAGVFGEMSGLFAAESATPPAEAKAVAETPGTAEEAPPEPTAAREPSALPEAPPIARVRDQAAPQPPLEASPPELPVLPETLADAETPAQEPAGTPEPEAPPSGSERAGWERPGWETAGWKTAGWKTEWMPAVAVGTVGFTLFLSILSMVLLYRLYSGSWRGVSGPERPAGISPNPQNAPRALFYCAQLSRDPARGSDDGVFDVTGGPTRIGRAPGPGGLVIPGKGISREHAVVEYRDYAYWVLDQGSANGTFVNNKRVERRQRLHHGDRVRFNETDFLFLMPGRQEADATVVVPLGERAAQAAG